MSEKSGLSLMFAVLVDASANWRGVKVSPAAALELESLSTLTKAPQAERLAV